MSKKIVLVQKKRGGCLGAFLAIIVVCLAIYAIALGLCVAAGVGLWFLARYIWRSLVKEKPDSPLVQRGLALAPIARKVAAAVPCVIVSFCLIGVLTSSTASSSSKNTAATNPAAQQTQPAQTTQQDSAAEKAEPAVSTPVSALDPTTIPAYSGSPYVEVQSNEPQFSDADKARGDFENYSDLDSLGRCGVAFALISTQTMPTQERGSIGMIKPSGWQTVRYDGLVDGNYLYNRCHLIGYQLAGENANEKNLITGTRYLNTEGMLPFEDQVAAYVKSTGNHVLYRATPVFEGNNLVASGVQLEAWSVEDKGAGVSFNVYCYNVQPGVTIDYATGESSLAEQAVEQGDDAAAAEAAEQSDNTAATAKDEASAAASTPSTQSAEQTYVLNTNSRKFHRTGCSFVSKMSAKNRKDFTGTRDEVIAQGYEPCQKCNP